MSAKPYGRCARLNAREVGRDGVAASLSPHRSHSWVGVGCQWRAGRQRWCCRQPRLHTHTAGTEKGFLAAGLIGDSRSTWVSAAASHVRNAMCTRLLTSAPETDLPVGSRPVPYHPSTLLPWRMAYHDDEKRQVRACIGLDDGLVPGCGSACCWAAWDGADGTCTAALQLLAPPGPGQY